MFYVMMMIPQVTRSSTTRILFQKSSSAMLLTGDHMTWLQCTIWFTTDHMLRLVSPAATRLRKQSGRDAPCMTVTRTCHSIHHLIGSHKLSEHLIGCWPEDRHALMNQFPRKFSDWRSFMIWYYGRRCGCVPGRHWPCYWYCSWYQQPLATCSGKSCHFWNLPQTSRRLRERYWTIQECEEDQKFQAVWSWSVTQPLCYCLCFTKIRPF